MSKETTKHTKAPWKIDYLGVVTGGHAYLTGIAEVPIVKWTNQQIDATNRKNQEAADHCGLMVMESQRNGLLISIAPELDAYRRYVEDNLERIDQGGWTPVCFGEFRTSAELEVYL